MHCTWMLPKVLSREIGLTPLIYRYFIYTCQIYKAYQTLPYQSVSHTHFVNRSAFQTVSKECLLNDITIKLVIFGNKYFDVTFLNKK